MTPPAPAYLNALTGLRFLAAFHVVLFHFRDLALKDGPEALYWIADKGYVSVGLFFVLSGFILTYTYADPTQSAPMGRRAFWVARFARIYPVYLLSVALAMPALLSATRGGETLPEGLARTAGVVGLVATLGQDWTLLPAMVWSHPDWSFSMGTLDWNFPVWSLGAEAFFYLLFPFVAPALTRLRLGALLALLLLCWGLAVAAPLAYPRVVPGASYPMDHAIPAWSWVINYTPIFRLPEFLFGIALGQVYCRYRLGLRHLWWRVLGSVAATASIAALLFSFVTIQNEPGLLMANGLFDPLFGLLIFGLAISNIGFAWLLARPAAVLLGEASYVLYVLHIPLWILLVSSVPGWMSAQATSGEPGWVDVYLVCAVGVAVAVFLWLERPARRWLRGLLMGRPSTPAARAGNAARTANARSTPEPTLS